MANHDLDAADANASATAQPRRQSLEHRVNEAATALAEQGLRPTVQRVRAALGGGSPNEITPALKRWKDLSLSGLTHPGVLALPDAPLPAPVADLARELWRRALAAAVLQLKTGNASTRTLLSNAEEARALRAQLDLVREQLERESLAFGELRAQAARHEQIAKQALSRAAAAEARERDQLRELGAKAAKIAVLEAQLKVRPSNGTPRAAAPRRRKSPRASIPTRRGKSRSLVARRRTIPRAKSKRPRTRKR